MKRDTDCLTIIDLFRKVITSLACIANVSSNIDIVNEANNYILDFINQYNKYLVNTNKKNIVFKYTEDDIVDLILFAEDLQFGIIDLIKLIK